MRRLIDYFFEHKKFYLTLILILIANLFFFSFFTLNEYKLFHNTESEIDSVEKELKSTERQYKKLKKVVDNVKKVKKQFPLLKEST